MSIGTGFDGSLTGLLAVDRAAVYSGNAVQAAVSLRSNPLLETCMRSYTAVVERDTETGLLVGHIPGFRGAHSQAAIMDELQANLVEVVAMLLEDGEPHFETEFVGIQTVRVA